MGPHRGSDAPVLYTEEGIIAEQEGNPESRKALFEFAAEEDVWF